MITSNEACVAVFGKDHKSGCDNGKLIDRRGNVVGTYTPSINLDNDIDEVIEINITAVASAENNTYEGVINSQLGTVAYDYMRQGVDIDRIGPSYLLSNTTGMVLTCIHGGCSSTHKSVSRTENVDSTINRIYFTIEQPPDVNGKPHQITITLPIVNLSAKTFYIRSHDTWISTKQAKPLALLRQQYLTNQQPQNQVPSVIDITISGSTMINHVFFRIGDIAGSQRVIHNDKAEVLEVTIAVPNRVNEVIEVPVSKIITGECSYIQTQMGLDLFIGVDESSVNIAANEHKGMSYQISKEGLAANGQLTHDNKQLHKINLDLREEIAQLKQQSTIKRSELLNEREEVKNKREEIKTDAASASADTSLSSDTIKLVGASIAATAVAVAAIAKIMAMRPEPTATVAAGVVEWGILTTTLGSGVIDMGLGKVLVAGGVVAAIAFAATMIIKKIERTSANEVYADVKEVVVNVYKKVKEVVVKCTDKVVSWVKAGWSWLTE